MNQLSTPSPQTSGLAPHVDEVPRIPPPSNQLNPRAKTLWTIQEAIQNTIGTVVVAMIAFSLWFFIEFSVWWPTGIVGAFALFGLLWTIFYPQVHYRFWRYEIREEEVDLQHGVFIRTRALIPMNRIQHVDTRTGPLQRNFGLASVVFYTAAGVMEIPALSNDVAADVRDRIAALAKVQDEIL